jgi:hypothetical protein
MSMTRMQARKLYELINSGKTWFSCGDPISRLYSDVRIALTGNFSSSDTQGDPTTAIFSSHQFILVSRSPYFHTALLSWPSSSSSSEEPPILNLPSPPFTPASLHFTLGYIYTGALIFSHRSYDLSTAFAILRASLYLLTSPTCSGICYGSRCEKSTSRTWFSTRPRWTLWRRMGSSRICF